MRDRHQFRPLQFLILAGFVCVVLPFSATPSLAQTGCPEAPKPTAATELSKQPVLKTTLTMMKQPAKTAVQRKPEVQVVCVPKLVGMSLEQAKAAIANSNGLKQGSVTPPDGVLVIAQNPGANRYVPVGTEITLQLKPAAPTSNLRTVPDITRVNESQLAGFLRGSGLAYGGSTTITTTDFPIGSVYQEPLAGSAEPENTPVFRFVAAAPSVQTQPTPYQLNLRASAANLSVNELVTFTATVTPPADGTQFQFNFGNQAQSALGTDASAQYQFPNDGTYSVTVTAQIPGGENLQVATAVQVHSTTWTVILDPVPTQAGTNSPIDFEVRLLPASPAPENPIYSFTFDTGSNPVNSNQPRIKHAFSTSGSHWARVVVRDADGHTFTSEAAGVNILTPLWVFLAPPGAAILAIGLGGMKAAQKITTRRLRYSPVPDSAGTRLVTAAPQGAFEAAFEFRTVHPPIASSAVPSGAIIKRVEIVA